MGHQLDPLTLMTLEGIIRMWRQFDVSSDAHLVGTGSISTANFKKLMAALLRMDYVVAAAVDEQNGLIRGQVRM